MESKRKKILWIILIFAVLLLFLLLFLWVLRKSRPTAVLPPAIPTPTVYIPPPGQYSISVTPDNLLQIKFSAIGTTVSATSVRLVYKFSGTPALTVEDQNPNKDGIQLQPNLDLIQKNWSYLINSADIYPDLDDPDSKLLIIALSAAVLSPEGYTPQKEEILATARLTISDPSAKPRFKFDPEHTKLFEKKSAAELPLTLQD